MFARCLLLILIIATSFAQASSPERVVLSIHRDQSFTEFYLGTATSGPLAGMKRQVEPISDQARQALSQLPFNGETICQLHAIDGVNPRSGIFVWLVTDVIECDLGQN